MFLLFYCTIFLLQTSFSTSIAWLQSSFLTTTFLSDPRSQIFEWSIKCNLEESRVIAFHNQLTTRKENQDTSLTCQNILHLIKNRNYFSKNPIKCALSKNWFLSICAHALFSKFERYAIGGGNFPPCFRNWLECNNCTFVFLLLAIK